MIIFDSHIYIHCPKTGGSSFEEMCKSRHGVQVWGKQHDIAADIPNAHLHKSVFGFIRDPLMAEVSNWRYHKFSWRGNAFFTFENWCKWRYGGLYEDFGFYLGLNEKQVKYGYRFNVRPTAGYFCDALGYCVADRIFRYEELSEGLTEISEMLGMDCSIDGFKKMQYSWGKGRENYMDHVTPKAAELVRSAKAIDFEIHEAPGKVSVDFTCPVIRNYAYTR
jgi:hypothetical protein